MTAVNEQRQADPLGANLAAAVAAWERTEAALPEAIGTAVAQALEAPVQAIRQEQEVRERQVALLSTTTDTLRRLMALNKGLVRRYQCGLTRLMLVFAGGALVGATVMFGVFMYILHATPPPARPAPPSAETLAAAPAQHIPRRPMPGTAEQGGPQPPGA